MSFDLLPADLILKIFHQLPFKDRVRLGGVSRSFRGVSEESIYKMKSLVINDDLVAYLIHRSFSSLLESCSPTLQSMDATNRLCNKWMLNALTEFVYPKMDHLKVTVGQAINDTNPPNMPSQVKKLISRCPNLRSIVLNLSGQLEWPENIIYEKMEKLKIHLHGESVIDLSPTLGPLIGKIPNLKNLAIKSQSSYVRLILSAGEFSQLLASTPSLEKLHLDLSSGTSVNISLDFKAAISTWRLPNLTKLILNFDWKCPNQASILRHFPVSFPRLESFSSETMQKIDDQALLAMPRLKYFCVSNVDMTKTHIIDLVTRFTGIHSLKIGRILGVSSPHTFIDFLASTAHVFRHRLEILLESMTVEGSQSELEDVLEEMKNSGGPAVFYQRDEDEDFLRIYCISYECKSNELDG